MLLLLTVDCQVSTHNNGKWYDCYIRMKIWFFNVHWVMKPVGRAKIPYAQSASCRILVTTTGFITWRKSKNQILDHFCVLTFCMLRYLILSISPATWLFFSNITSFSYFLEWQNPDFFPFSNIQFLLNCTIKLMFTNVGGVDYSAKTCY